VSHPVLQVFDSCQFFGFELPSTVLPKRISLKKIENRFYDNFVLIV